MIRSPCDVKPQAMIGNLPLPIATSEDRRLACRASLLIHFSKLDGSSKRARELQLLV